MLAATGVLVAELVARPGAAGGMAHLVPAAAVVLTTLYAGALANRAGGRPVVCATVGLGLGLAAQLSQEPVLLAGVSVATAVVAGILAVMETVPATGVLQAVREVLVATVVAGVGALAVTAYDTSIDPGRFRYLALVAAALGIVALVGGLGAGLHGLGRRGALVLAAGTLLLVAVVLYGEALSRWGTPELEHAVAQVRSMIRVHLHAVPHPIQALLGFPALTWGVVMRARRRQGWWVCAFGVAATVSTACALIGPTGSLAHVLLGSGYSLVLGIAIGYLVIRLDLLLTGPRGQRARRDEQALAHRPEPGRTRSLR
ncbi:MAG: hypothetical protein ACR2FG_10480 [Marmoricola sp.]